MAKYVFFASTGYVGADIKHVVNIPDELLEGKTEVEREQIIEDNFNDWVSNYVELSFWEADEDEDVEDE